MKRLLTMFQSQPVESSGDKVLLFDSVGSRGQRVCLQQMVAADTVTSGIIANFGVRLGSTEYILGGVYLLAADHGAWLSGPIWVPGDAVPFVRFHDVVEGDVVSAWLYGYVDTGIN